MIGSINVWLINLSLKHATKLCKVSRNATKTLSIINHWYDLSEKTISNLQLENWPDLIRNVDESSLPSESKKCHVGLQMEQKTLQIVTGSDKDNTTILTTSSTSGTTLLPLIISQGKQGQTTWRPFWDPTREHVPWIYPNESGWIKVGVFHIGFVEREVRRRTANNEGELETRLMIYDGHLSHVSYATIRLARETRFTILKLKAHTTDINAKLASSVIQTATENSKCTVKVQIRNNNMYVCVSEGKKCFYFGKFVIPCFLETPVLRFALLPHYQRNIIRRSYWASKQRLCQFVLNKLIVSQIM